MHAVSLLPHARCMWCHSYRACKVLALSLIPHAHVHAVSLIPHAWCMWWHWYRMHGACGVIDTACTNKFLNNFEQWKSYAKQRWYAKKLKMHALSIRPHARCMRCHWHRMHDACGVIDTACTCACGVNDTTCMVRMALAAFKGNIYQKHICSRIVLPHH
jgi:hypothetical protein